MKKVISLFMAFTCLWAVAQVSQRATTGWDYPFHPGDEQWKSYTSPQERIAALQIPEDKLKSISTSDLLNVCLEFPYTMDMLAFDSPEIGFNAVCKEFNGYRELLTRQDLADALLAKCEDIPVEIDSILNKDELTQGDYSFRCYVLFYMMGLDEVTSSLNSEKMGLFTSSIRTATEKMKDYPDIFGISYKQGMKISTLKQRTYNPQYNYTTRLTQNGYSVRVRKLISEDYSSLEIVRVKNAIRGYEVEILENPTLKYNCHSYAWHMRGALVDDLVWVLNLPLPVYWQTGCYYEVPEAEAEVVFYHNSSSPMDSAFWHSAVRINSNEYISKWGSNCLVRHSPDNVPSSYGKSRKYYKLYEPQIIGPDSISSTSTYSIAPLPDGYSVTWSLSDSYYAQNCVTIDDNGNYTITRSSNRDMNNATLTATIKYNGYVAKTLTRRIKTYKEFICTYNWGNPQKVYQLKYPYIIYVNNNSGWLYIDSENFIGADITYDGDMTPTHWVVDKLRGNISILLPYQPTGQALVISVNCTNGAFYRIIILNQLGAYSLSAKVDSNILDINLNKNETETLDRSIMAYLDISEPNRTNRTWTLDVYDTTNNQMMYSNKILDLDTGAQLNTSGWTSGIYIVRATIGDNTLSKKILIK